MSAPADVQAILDDLAGLEEQFERLLAPLSPAQLHWQAEAGKSWSIVQCVDHLARTNRIYLPALADATAAGRAAGRLRRGALRPNALGRCFVWMIEPPVRLRVPVPLAELIPPSEGDPVAIRDGFRAAQAEVATLLAASADLDLIGPRFRNPLARDLKMFNLATGFLVIAAHERRHLAQAQKVRAHPGFPA